MVNDFFFRVPTDFKQTVYCTGIQYGHIEDWDHTWLRYLYSMDTHEKTIFLVTLTCSRDKFVLKRYVFLYNKLCYYNQVPVNQVS